MGPLSLLQRSSRLTVWEKPFPHIIIHDPLIKTKMPSFPKVSVDKGHVGRVSADNYVCGSTGDRAWNNFVSHHTSQAFYDEVIHVFGDFIPKTLHDAEVGMRGRTKKAGQMDCQFVENPSSKTDYRTQVPHLDNPCELYAGMWYFRDPDDKAGGEFVLYPRKEPIKVGDVEGHKRVLKSKIMPVLCIPYTNDVFIMFLNGPQAIHGASRQASEFPRRYINVICDFRRPLFDI